MAAPPKLCVLVGPAPAPGAPVSVGALVTTVGATTPDVNGVLPSEAVEAPGKATPVVDGLGAAEALAGLRTLF